MAARTRKATATAPEKVEVVVDIDETVAAAEEAALEAAPPKRRGGRTASPLTAVLKEFETAKNKLATANKRLAKVNTVVEQQEAAEARFKAAKEALDAVYSDLTA